MVAVISGNGLGLGNSSLGSLGSQGAVGNASAGKAGEQVYVNSTTGDLVIQDLDDSIAALGAGLAVTRTYNSQGQLSDDFGGTWRLGVNERLINPTGTLNTAGSTITKVFGDESEVVFVYDTTRGKYAATGQAGAEDELTYNSSSQQWTWVNGATRASEVYSSSGQLLQASDASGNTRTYAYIGAQLSSVTLGGQITHFDYTGTNLTQIRVVSPDQTQTVTHYIYDSQNRLKVVTTDLSPQDNSVTDGRIYTTTYAYDGTSDRVISITHSDGTSISFNYQLVAGTYRIKTYTESDVGQTTATANSSVLQTTATQTVTNTYSLNTSALTAPHWTESLFDNTPNREFITDAVFNESGDGFMAWQPTPPGSTAATAMYVSKFSAATQSWGSPVALTVPAGQALGNVKLAIDQQGNAVAVWGSTSIFTSVYNKNTNTWGATQTLATGVNAGAAQMHVSLNGTNAVMTYGVLQANHAGLNTYNLYVIRMNNGAWGGPELIQSGASTYANAQRSDGVGIDTQGNVTVLWTDANASTSSVYSRRFTAASGTWGAIQTLDTNPDGPSGLDNIQQIRFVFDVNGNGFAIWRRGGDSDATVTNQIMGARWDRASGSWGSTILMHTADHPGQTFVGVRRRACPEH